MGNSASTPAMAELSMPSSGPMRRSLFRGRLARVSVSSSTSLIGNNKQRQEVSQQKCSILLRKISTMKKNPPYSSAMSMEVKLNSVGGGDSHPFFRDGRVELPGSFGACRDVKGSGGDELCEEIKPEQEPDSASMATGRLAKGALA